MEMDEERLQEEVERLQHRIDCIMGRSSCELVLRHADVADIANGEVLHDVDIAVDEGSIIDIGQAILAKGKDEQTANPGIYVPGFIDSHVNIESSFLTPAGFSDMVIPFGTTTVVADPHEIANVAGTDGIDYMLRACEGTVVDVRFMLPSCVPASHFESAGARLRAEDLEPYFAEERVLGLAEVMDVPALLSASGDMVKKLAMARLSGKVIDGHAPGLNGSALSAYAAVGVVSDHEGSTPTELRDRVARGIAVNLREGSAAQNVEGLSAGVNEANASQLMLCCDDAGADEVFEKGHVVRALRKAVACGIPAMQALCMVSINAARHYKIQGKGLLAPGYVADMVCVSDLKEFKAKEVWRAGRLVARDGGNLVRSTAIPLPEEIGSSVNIGEIEAEAFEIELTGKANVIGIVPGQIITKHLERALVANAEGFFEAALNPGVAKIAVLERHHGTGRIGVGLISGFTKEGAFMQGAIATSVSHDSHNLIVCGDDDGDMVLAVHSLKDMGGGICVVQHGQIIASLALPVAGLMSDLPAEILSSRKRVLVQKAREALSVAEGVHPVMTLSFMALTAIPSLRMTDLGLFDAKALKRIGVCED